MELRSANLYGRRRPGIGLLRRQLRRLRHGRLDVRGVHRVHQLQPRGQPLLPIKLLLSPRFNTLKMHLHSEQTW